VDDQQDYFGENVAATYDDSSDLFGPGAVDPAVDVLAGLAGGGSALELGIGTGRIALPLARRGVRVYGIDLSRAMVARLRAKSGGDAIGVTIGDFADGSGKYRTMPFRYVWPAELDLMAELAGMRLRDRWDGWTREPFTSESRQHVSIWEKPANATAG
jgi:SAM-dependent methyltransferase